MTHWSNVSSALCRTWRNVEHALQAVENFRERGKLHFGPTCHRPSAGPGDAWKLPSKPVKTCEHVQNDTLDQRVIGPPLGLEKRGKCPPSVRAWNMTLWTNVSSALRRAWRGYSYLQHTVPQMLLALSYFRRGTKAPGL